MQQLCNKVQYFQMFKSPYKSFFKILDPHHLDQDGIKDVAAAGAEIS